MVRALQIHDSDDRFVPPWLEVRHWLVLGMGGVGKIKKVACWNRLNFSRRELDVLPKLKPAQAFHRQMYLGTPNVPTDIPPPIVPTDIPTPSTSDAGSTRRRGRSLRRRINDEDGKLKISTNEFGQADNPNITALVEHIGGIVSKGSIIPLDALKWKDVLEVDKQNALDKIDSRFEFDNRPQAEKWLRAKINECWKSTKNRLKTAWHSHDMDIVAQYEHRPPTLMGTSGSDWSTIGGVKRAR